MQGLDVLGEPRGLAVGHTGYRGDHQSDRDPTRHLSQLQGEGHYYLSQLQGEGHYYLSQLQGEGHYYLSQLQGEGRYFSGFRLPFLQTS